MGMNLALTREELRLLCDLVYVGTWIINSPRGEDRIDPYDQIASKVFYTAAENGMRELCDIHTTERATEVIPSRDYVDGGIHEVIMDYEDAAFMNILAEELARRDLASRDVDGEDAPLLSARVEEYLQEFSMNGLENIHVTGVEESGE